jgi:hypothetical protein
MHDSFGRSSSLEVETKALMKQVMKCQGQVNDDFDHFDKLLNKSIIGIVFWWFLENN